MIKDKEFLKAVAEAQRWVVELTSGCAADEDWVRFETWRSDSPLHDEAYLYIQSMSDMVTELAHLGQLEPLNMVDEPLFQSWWRRFPFFATEVRWVRPAFATVMVLFLVIGLNFLYAGRLAPNIHRTATGEIHEVILADGSVIHLGAESRVRVDYGAAERRITLEAGEALFSVVHNPQKPFVVVAENGLIRALGTIFNVHNGPEGVTVSVLEGAVRILNRSAKNLGKGDAVWVDEVPAGHEVAYSEAGDVGAVEMSETNRAAAWRHGRLEYVQSPLVSVIADFNRYADTTIFIANSALDDIPVTASFGTGDSETLLRGLERVLAVRVMRITPYIIVLSSKTAT